jgi:hypothetical protein
MSDGRERAEHIASALLDQARLSAADADRRIADARNESYWRALAPDFPICSAKALAERGTSAERDRSANALAERHLRDEGYFQLDAVLDADALVRLNRLVDTITAAGWPGSFAWIYDDVWSCVRLPALQSILTAALGDGYLHIPHLWIHEVPAVAGASGWSPHFDGHGSRRTSVWLALTDATVDNGCMHVVPRSALAASFQGDWPADQTIPIRDAIRALHASRALPVRAGTALGWTFDTLHWGGPSAATRERQSARRAISLEFIAGDETPEPHETPLLDPRGPLPSFAERLSMIARALATYEHFEPRLARWRDVAARLTLG